MSDQPRRGDCGNTSNGKKFRGQGFHKRADDCFNSRNASVEPFDRLDREQDLVDVSVSCVTLTGQWLNICLELSQSRRFGQITLHNRATQEQGCGPESIDFFRTLPYQTVSLIVAQS